MYFQPEQPNVTWNEIAGLGKSKEILTGLSDRPGPVLLYGLPGSGMKLLGKAFAAGRNAAFFLACPVRIISPRLGGTKINLKRLLAESDQYDSPVVFFDELDVFFSQDQERTAITAAFLDFMNEARKPENPKIVLAAANYPDLLEPEILCSFETRIYIGLPDASARYQIFERNLRSALNFDQKDLDRLVRETGHRLLTCAELIKIARHLSETVSESGSVPNKDLFFERLKILLEESQIESGGSNADRLAVYHDWDPTTFEDEEYESTAK